jgi:hypothetical protein
MREKRVCGIQFLFLAPYRLQPPVDHLRAFTLAAVKNVSDLGEAEADFLAGAHDAQALQMFIGVVAMACHGATGNHHAFVLPVAKHVGCDADSSCRYADFHGSMVSLDFRST